MDPDWDPNPRTLLTDPLQWTHVANDRNISQRFARNLLFLEGQQLWLVDVTESDGDRVVDIMSLLPGLVLFQPGEHLQPDLQCSIQVKKVTIYDNE